MTDTTKPRPTPQGYWLEWRPGRVCLLKPEHFALETQSPSALIRGLYSCPQPGCRQEPAAYLGRFWHEAEHYAEGGSKSDPDAVPLYLGPVLHDPGPHWNVNTKGPAK